MLKAVLHNVRLRFTEPIALYEVTRSSVGELQPFSNNEYFIMKHEVNTLTVLQYCHDYETEDSTALS